MNTLEVKEITPRSCLSCHKDNSFYNKGAKASRLLLTFLFLIIFIINIGGCTSINISKYPDGTTFVQDKRLKKQESRQNVSFSIINTGDFKQIESILTSSGSSFKKVRGSLPCVVVKHPRGIILYDVGLGKNVDRDFDEAIPFGKEVIFPYRLKETAYTQMQTSGIIHPDSVRTIVMSHLHCDHASGIEDFPNAEVWTTNKDYNYAIKKMGRGFSRSMFDNDKIKWRFIRLQDKPYENFDKSLDVFGDGSVVLVPLPGHTPGHLGMFVNLKSGKRFLFIGNATLCSDDVKVPAKPWTEKFFVYDNETTNATIVRIYRLIQKYPDLVVMSSHDSPDKLTGFAYPRFIK